MRATPPTIGTLICLVVTGLLCAGAASAAVAQPCGTYSGRGCAPESRRVDLATPSFTEPTRVDNPLFPIEPAIRRVRRS